MTFNLLKTFFGRSASVSPSPIETDSRTELHEAAKAGNILAIRWEFYSCPANLYVKDPSGKTPFYLAAQYGRTTVINRALA